MAENEDQDKSEEASPYKLAQARKKGQVAKSMEINSLVTLVVFAVFSVALFDWFVENFAFQFKQYLINSGKLNVTTHSTIDLFIESTTLLFTLLSPLIIALIIMGVGVTIMQTKPIFTTEPLTPKFSKLNPISGFKKIISLKSLFELLKTIIKLGAIATLLVYGLKSIMPDLLATKYLAPGRVSEYWRDQFSIVTTTIILVLTPFAIFDLLFTKKQFSKKMKMSKREVKEEVKKRDGDPEVRAKRKKIQNELLKRTSAISDVKDSDVIITNPNHYAVALQYIPHKMIAPIVIAKGSDLLADKIKRIGLSHNIPIFRQPELTRKIFKETEIRKAILESNYGEIAPIFRWVFESKGRVF